jgi:hypothetical protein
MACNDGNSCDLVPQLPEERVQLRLQDDDVAAALPGVRDIFSCSTARTTGST